jgi:hypothetical protein
MTRFHLALLSALLATAAMLAGCAVLRQAQDDMPPSVGVPGTALGDAALTMPHFVRGNVHPDHGSSWMDPAYGINGARRKSRLLYVGDDSTNDVFVYEYNSGKQIGKLTGFDAPYGMCVDAKGDVYTANFDNGTVAEYARGGTTAINTYHPGGEPIGCAVNAKNDLAVTSFDPGDVTVFARGNPSKAKTYSDPDCEVLWTMGYDNKGNLVGIGEYSSIDVCALLAGAKTMTTLGTSPKITIDFPGGTAWDGKYYALAGENTITQATLKNVTLTWVSETFLGDDCYGDNVDVYSPFIVGKKNTPINDTQGNVLVNPNLACLFVGPGKVDYWHYPSGGLPFKVLSPPPADPYGAAVSIVT